MLAVSDFVDAERVEILRGPQNLLYGKNTSAGVLALYTRMPPEHFEAGAEVTSGVIDTNGSPSLSNLKIRLGGPVTPTLRTSIAAVHSQHGHTLANSLADAPDGNNENRLAVRGQLAWSPSANFDLRLLAGYGRVDDDEGESDLFLAPGSPSSAVGNALHQAGFSNGCDDNDPHNRRACSAALWKLDLQTIDLTLLGRYRLPNGSTLISVTGWDRYESLRIDDDIGQVFTPVLFFQDTEEGGSVQQELRLTSAPGAVSWLAGVFYYANDYERGMNGERPMFGPSGPAAFDPVWSTLLGGLPLALPGQLGIHDSYLDTRYLSAFGEVVWKLTERWSLTGGLRWQREKKDAAINNSVTMPGASLISTTLTPSVSPGGEAVNGTTGRDSTNVTWSATGQYLIREEIMSYLTVAQGAKSGGFNTGFGNAPLAAREFGDERIQHYEIGARGAFAGGRARLNAAAFHTEYHDYQDAAFVSAQFSVGNAGRVVLKGAELEGAVLFPASVTVDFGVSAADLRYAENTTGACFPGRIPDGTLPRSCNLAGEHPINAPVWATHLGVLYQHSVAWGAIYSRIDWSWTDEYNTSFSADPRLVQQPFSDVALRIGTHLGDNCEIVFWVDNLLGEDVAEIDAVLNLFNDRSYQSYMAQPRRYGATVRFSF